MIGNVVATRKNENLTGNKLLIVEPYKQMSVATKIIAIDNVGAGIGEDVLVALGSAARIGCAMSDVAVDAAIIGIIDDAGRLCELCD